MKKSQKKITLITFSLIMILVISVALVLAARPDWVTDKINSKEKGPKNKELKVKEKNNPVMKYGKEQCIVEREINGKMKKTNICIGETKELEILQRNVGHGKSQRIRIVPLTWWVPE